MHHWGWVIIVLLVRARAQSPFPYQMGAVSCSATSVFDPTSLQCITCPTLSLPNAQRTACQCMMGYALSTPATSPFTPLCRSCFAQGLTSTRDGTSCTACNTTTGAVLSSTTHDCSCPSSYIITDVNVAGRPLGSKHCIACPADHSPALNDAYSCVQCQHPAMTVDPSSGVCVCPAPIWTAAGTTCVATQRAAVITTTWPVASASTRVFKDIHAYDGATLSPHLTQSSQHIGNLFLWAASECKFGGTREACQCLLNICVLQMYDLASPACDLFAKISQGNTATSPNWMYPMQWALDDSVVTSANLRGTVTLTGATSQLNYLLVSFYLNGTLASIAPLSSQLQLCPTDPSRVGLFGIFGTQYDNECYLSLSSLVTGTKTLFYDLYYIDNGNIFPVPLKMLNFQSGGQYVHMDANHVETSTTMLSGAIQHRFILVDNLSAITSGTTLPNVLTYAKSIIIRVTMETGSSSSIYPPLIVILYAQREVSSFVEASAASSTVSFSAQYTKDLSSLWSATNVLFVLAMLLIGFSWLLDLWKMSLVSNLEAVTINVMARALLILAETSANVLFWLVYIMCAYCFIFFKGQATAFLLMPVVNGPEEYIFVVTVVYVFICKFLSIVRTVWNQINIDLFFIDWEKPRRPANDDKASPSVSIWRKLFVANEWNELQSYRTINIELSLLLLLFFLRGINLEYLATSQPSMNLSPTSASINIILRFAVTSSLFLGICALQRVYRQLIHHRFIEHKPTQFIDFMTMSNISAFILDSESHGYYIHGRTLHAFADSNMEEMTKQLHMEKKEMVKRRGLINGKDTFEMFVTREFRLHYMSIFKEILFRRIVQNHDPRSQSPHHHQQLQQSQVDVKMDETTTLVKANAKLNRFLHNFIDQNSSSYSWGEAHRTFLERLFNVPPVIKGSSSSFFYDDPNYGFTSVFLMGIEYEIATFLMSLYAISDIAFNNTFVSILIMFSANIFLSHFRDHWGQINISKKTLVDDRFLI